VKLTNAYRDGDVVVAETAEPRQLAFLDLRTGAFNELAAPPDAYGPAFLGGRSFFNMSAVSAATQVAVFRCEDGAGTRLRLVSQNGHDTAVWQGNEYLKQVEPLRYQMLRYELGDGRDYEAALVLPGYQPAGARVPLVVTVYPGSGRQWDRLLRIGAETDGMVAHPLLATMGYAVLVYPPALPELLRTPDGNPLGGWAAVVLPAVDAAVATGTVDPERIALNGYSQGSWSALSVITQTSRFRAAVAAFGIADLVSYYGGLGGGILERLRPDDVSPLDGETVVRLEGPAGYPSLGAAPWDDPTGYVRASPLFQVRKIQTPLLLVNSDLDGFPMQQFDEMYTAMVRLRKDAQYVRYWGDWHSPGSPANLRDYWSRLLAWYDEYLDITRDAQGQMIYVDDHVKSRGGAGAWSPERFRDLKWFFGRDTGHAQQDCTAACRSLAVGSLGGTGGTAAAPATGR
jgi:dipeptidyl aminopeptidase/acylaminoacyl peptidase